MGNDSNAKMSIKQRIFLSALLAMGVLAFSASAPAATMQETAPAAKPVTPPPTPRKQPLPEYRYPAPQLNDSSSGSNSTSDTSINADTGIHADTSIGSDSDSDSSSGSADANKRSTSTTKPRTNKVLPP